MALNVRTKSPAPYQTLMLPQDTQEEEEVVSLASGFDNEVDPFSIEQPVAPVELDSSLYGGQARPFVDTVAMNERLAAEDPAAVRARINASLGYDLYDIDANATVDPAKMTAYAADVQRPQLLQDINLSRDSFTDEEFTDNTKFWDIYTPKEAEFKQGQRDSLTDLYSTDNEQFSTVYNNLDVNSQLNFLEGQYSQNNIDKNTYLEQAAGLLYADDARRNDPNAEPAKQYFVKGDILYEIPSLMANDPTAPFYAREVILFDDQKLSGTSRDSRLNEEQLFKRAIGQTNYESADSESKWKAARDNVIRPIASTVLSFATAGMSDAVQAAVKGAQGETLKGSDWASLASAGLNFADVTKAGTGAAAGGMGPVDTGTGLFGSTYNQTQGLIKAAGAGDLKEAAVGLVLPKILEGVKSKLPPNSLLSLPESFEAGLSKTIEEMAGGSSFEDALKVGGIEYIREGGLKPIEGALKDALEPLVDTLQPVVEQIEDTLKPLGDVLSAADTAARQGLAEFDKTVLQQFTQPVGDVLSQADTAVRQGAAAFDREVLQPFTQPAGDVIEDVAQATGDVVEDVGQATGDVAEDVGQEVGDALSAAETAVRQALEDIDLPDIGLPNINLPVPTRAPSATRTTGGLFDVAQFEHDEGISLVGNLLTGLTEQDAKKLSKKQFQQPKEEMVDLLSDPFANAFNYKV